MGGKTETVEIDAIPDIAAEQAALAAKEGAATQQVEKQAAEVKAPVAEDKTPAQKQAEDATKAEEGETTSFDDFLNQKNKPATTVAGTLENKTSSQAKTPEEKPAATPVAKQEDSRDLTGIAPEHQELFKRMSNEAFNVLKAEYLENRALKQQLAEAKKGSLPESYYEHESAYVLTPEFSAASENVAQAETILNHYTQQLADLRAGGDTYTVLQRNAQGQLVASAPVKADRNTVDQMADIRQAAYQQLLNEQAKLSAVGASHKAKATEAKQWLQDFESRAFPAFATPELQTVANDTMQKVLHKSYHNNPLAKLFAKAVVVMTEQAKALQAAKAAPQQQPVQVAAKKQPSAAEIASGGAAATTGAEKEVSFDDFQKAKKGLL